MSVIPIFFIFLESSSYQGLFVTVEDMALYSTALASVHITMVVCPSLCI